MKVSTTTIRAELRQKHDQREHVQLRETLCWDIFIKLECSEDSKLRFNLFLEQKQKTCFTTLCHLLEKMPDYVILHVGTNDAMDYEASAIVEKIIHVKEFIKLRVPNCKVIISRPTKRHDNENAPRVIEEVIAQFQKLTNDMKQNENIGKKQLGKRGFHLDGFSLKKFRQNLIARTGEL